MRTVDARLLLLAQVLAPVEAHDLRGAMQLTVARAGALGMPGPVAAAVRTLAELGGVN